MPHANIIQRIKDTITVDEVLGRYGTLPLRRCGKGRAGPCPLCGVGKNKRSRAFTVSADGHAWFCFGDCKRGGSVVDLVMALERCDLVTACTLMTSRHIAK